MASPWQRRASRWTARVNLAGWIALAAPRVAVTAVVLSGLVLAARRAQVGVGGLYAAAGVALAVAGAWALAAWWPRRYRRAQALARLDDAYGMQGALLASAEGVAPTPPVPAGRGIPVRWRLRGVWAPLLGAVAVLAAAFLVPVGTAAPPPVRATARPPTWDAIAEAVEILEEEPLVPPAAPEQWKAQLAELERLPEEDWFADETQEAADALWGQLRSTVARAERAVAPVTRALERALATEDAARTAEAQQALQAALDGAKGQAATLSPDLAERLARLDPKDLPSLPQDSLQRMRAELARAEAAGRRARRALGAREGEGEGEGEEGPGQGGTQRGPGTAPIQLTPFESPRGEAETARLDVPTDLDAARLGDVVRTEATAPEVDEAADRGPRAVAGAAHVGGGGVPVWQLRLTPDEQDVLRKYFE